MDTTSYKCIHKYATLMLSTYGRWGHTNMLVRMYEKLNHSFITTSKKKFPNKNNDNNNNDNNNNNNNKGEKRKKRKRKQLEC